MALEITQERVIEIQALLAAWLTKNTTSLKELQSLLGKLSFVSSSVQPGRIFVQRPFVVLLSIYSNKISKSVIPDTFTVT